MDIASSSSKATARPDGVAAGCRKCVMPVHEGPHSRRSASFMPYRPVPASGHEARRAQAALRVAGAAGAAVGDLDALAGAGEQHRVVAHDVAAADGGKADGRRVALARGALAGEDARSP
jgi:hypothetical protein